MPEPYLVHSCGEECGHFGEECDGVAVFANSSEEAVRLGKSYLEEPRAAAARSNERLEPLRPFGPVVGWNGGREIQLAWREAGWHEIGEAPCESCLKASCGIDDLRACEECGLCPECGCDCEEGAVA